METKALKANIKTLSQQVVQQRNDGNTEVIKSETA